MGGGILNKTQTLEQEESLKNTELAIYVEDEKTNTIPAKDSGYYYDREKSSCTNEAYIVWDYETWSPVVKNVKTYPTRCEIHFTTTYTEDILNGTDPVLKNELVPVTIDNGGTDAGMFSFYGESGANSVGGSFRIILTPV